MSYKFPPGAEMGARMRPGLYYSPSGASSTTATTLDALTVVPIMVPRAVNIDRIGINVTVASGTGGSEARLGIYADIDDEYGGFPGDLVSGSAVSVATDSVAFVAGTIDVDLDPGLYWLAFVTQTATCTVARVDGPHPAVGHNQSANVGTRIGYRETSVSGALPATFGGPENAQGGIPAPQIRVGS